MTIGAMSDQDLSAAVAREVMGWSEVDSEHYGPGTFRIGDGLLVVWSCTTPSGMCELLERMKKLGFEADLRVGITSCLACFTKIPIGPYIMLPVDIDGYIKADTLPLAVARAALEACRKETK